MLKNAKGAVKNFLGRTFWNNDGALRCNLAGIAISLMCRNVDRSFWSIGSGGVCQTLFTALMNNAVYPRHGFSDCAILYQDEEMRRQVDLLLPYVKWAAQEGTEGGSANTKNTRRCMYKKFCYGDPIMARRPYAIVTKLIPLVGLLRFEIDNPLDFANAKEGGSAQYLPKIIGR